MGVVVPMPTLPLEFQMPLPAKYASPDTEDAVEDAYVAVRRESEESKGRAEESVNAPAVVMNGTRPDVSAETVRLVVLAVPKYPVPLAVMAVEDAYGNVDAAFDVEVIAPVLAIESTLEYASEVLALRWMLNASLAPPRLMFHAP